MSTVDISKLKMEDFRKEHGDWRGISTPTPEVKSWLKHELGQE